MIQIRNIAKLGLLTLLTSYTSASYSATIIVNTDKMDIDVAGAQFISQDPAGRSGLYRPDTLTITDLNNISKNPADINTGADPLDPAEDKPAISLPEAIIAANNTTGADIIILPVNSGPYELSTVNNYWYGPNALPPITSTIHIRGDGVEAGARLKSSDNGVVIQRSLVGASPANMRLFFVMSGTYIGNDINKVQISPGFLTLTNLSIKNGLIKGGDGSGGGAGLGGAIYNQGQLTINNVTFNNNKAFGGDGGSTAYFGGGGIAGNGNVDIGGGFYQTKFIDKEQFIHPDNLDGDPNNDDINKNTLSIFGGNGGPDGSGGFSPTNDNGINGGRKEDTGSSRNDHGAFGAGGGRPAPNGSSENGNGGAFGSGGGYGVIGGPGGFGGGGGQNSSNVESIAGFAGGKGTQSRGGGGAGLGGAIFNHNGLLFVDSSTFSGNSVQGGAGGQGGSAYGAAIFSLNSPSINIQGITVDGTQIIQSTIFDNTCTATAGGSCNSPVYNLSATGDGIQDGNVGSSMSISNSIVANKESPQYTSLSNNKIGVSANSILNLKGKNVIRNSINNANGAQHNYTTSNFIDSPPFPNFGHADTPKAGILRDNGGLTETILPTMRVITPAVAAIPATPTSAEVPAVPAVISASPAIDATGNQQLTSTLDQRFVERKKDTDNVATDNDSIADIGAVESGYNKAPVITVPSARVEIGDSAPVSIQVVNGQAVFILSDSDANNTFDVEVTITATNGKLNLAPATLTFFDNLGVTFSNNVVDEDSLIVNGPLSSINSTLTIGNIKIPSLISSLTFTPNPGLGSNSNDCGSITIEIDDLGNSGEKPLIPEQAAVGDTAATACTPFIPGSSLIPAHQANSLKDKKTIIFDIKSRAPTVVISGAPKISNSSAFPILIAFNEPVSGFTVSDIQLLNATVISGLAEIVPSQLYSVTIRPNGQGDISIEVPADAVVDPLNLTNLASNKAVINLDATRPSITVTGIPAKIGNSAFTATFSFSEDVTGFTIEDIKASNAQLSAFTSIDKKSYSVSIAPTGDSGIEINVDENIATDSLGNGNTALSSRSIPLQRGSGSGSPSLLFLLCGLLLPLMRRKLKDQ